MYIAVEKFSNLQRLESGWSCPILFRGKMHSAEPFLKERNYIVMEYILGENISHILAKECDQDLHRPVRS